MIFAPGDTSKSLDILIVDDSGLPVTGLVSATFPTLKYSLAGANADATITTSDLATLATAYSSGGVKERGEGRYRLDLPNAALASAGAVTVRGEATGKRVVCEPITVAYVQSDVRQLLGTAWLAPAVAGTPDVNAKQVGGQTASAAGTVTFPGTIASTTNITAASGVALAASQHVIVDSGTVTTLTSLPTAPTDWLSAAAVSAAAATKVANAVEAAVLDEGDATALLAAIGAKVETFLINEGDASATLAAIAAAVRTNLATELGRIDAAVSTRQATFTAGTGITFPSNFSALAISAGGVANANVALWGGGTVFLLDTGSGDYPAVAVQFINGNKVTAAALATDAVTEIQSGLATAANLATLTAYVDTEVAAIKAKTDNLPASPASTGDVTTGLDALPTAAENAAALLAAGDVDGFSLQETLKLCLAALAGKLSGAATTTVTIRSADDTANRLVATVDESGNRTSVTLNAAG